MPRAIAAILTLLCASAIALVCLMVGLFSDWSGQHRIYPLPLVVGTVILLLGLYAAVRIWRGPPAKRRR